MAYAKELAQGGFAPGQASIAGGAYKAVTAAGSAQSDAAVLTASMCMVTAADGTKGVILPAGLPGDECWVFNNAGSTLKVYPPSGSAIAVAGTGTGTADAAFSQLTYKTTVYKILTSTQILACTSA